MTPTAAAAAPASPRARRWRRLLTSVTTGTATAGLVLAVAPLALQAPPSAAPRDHRSDVRLGTAGDLLPVSHRKRHPHRVIKKYRVRPGDTASSVAVRYHAWTDELIRINHSSVLYVGDVIRVPVVRSAQRACTRHRNHHTNVGRHARAHVGRPGRAHPGHAKKHHPKKHHAAKHHNKKHPAKHRPKKPHQHKHHVKKHKKHHTSRHLHAWSGHRGRHPRGWHHAGTTRDDVRRIVTAKARRYGVDPSLALAIAWQESGWQQRRVSASGALGVMQVLPGTARWMSDVAGYRLNPRDLHHNTIAGVRLIRWLRSEAGLRHAVGGYYQGLGGIREHGMYPSTKRYVDDVLSLRRTIADGRRPY
ncbi:transglycosylase SLT domain-containing protein [Nocardioides mesophilus]|uniref:Transglycosylase SLT domain-containing protein n=1 Tax=Nocardioides mesophilus TaxID=433659 RepID=A0A7G9RBZ3_9ACTN|nr:transglycosylase SLT domain-containing protein [Nocardioides mesophilus]QNN53118.1 transglycosylase SLT domain-containing protein [Nocardioides mesophilus]